MSKFILLFIFICCGVTSAQIIQNPILHTLDAGRKDGSYYPGRAYYRWVIDINHDGLEDVLISVKERPDEIQQNKDANRWFFNPDEHGFKVYIRVSDGGYVAARIVEEDKPEGEGITLDLSHCYVGYVSEAKSYGIVTLESLTVDDPDEPHAKHGVLKRQVVCYTVDGDHLKRTNLTFLSNAGGTNPVYDKYLSDSKRTKVQLQLVKP